MKKISFIVSDKYHKKIMDELNNIEQDATNFYTEHPEVIDRCGLASVILFAYKNAEVEDI